MMIKAYAKINVGLNVLNKREDGYHDLDMVMLPITLHDSIEVKTLKNENQTFVTCDAFELIDSDYNLVTNAVALLRKKYKFKENFQITIYKRIPIAAGLGGGSSDAASVIKYLNTHLKINASEDELADLLKDLGSDIPFFIYNKPARVKGKGEQLEFFELKNSYYCLVLKPKLGLSTKKVFEKSDTMEIDTFDMDKIIDFLKTDDLEALDKVIGNSLEKPAFHLYKELKELKEEIKNLNLKPVLMSGSGSSIFALSKDKNELFEAAKVLSKKYKYITIEICKTN